MLKTYYLFVEVCPWPVKVISFELAWTSNIVYIFCWHVRICHLLPETLLVWILVYIPQNFILKNNLQRQHLLMIPLSQQIREKFAHETLDNSQMKKNSDKVTSGKLYIRSKLNNLIWMCWMWFPIVTEELFKEASTVLTWTIS